MKMEDHSAAEESVVAKNSKSVNWCEKKTTSCHSSTTESSVTIDDTADVVQLPVRKKNDGHHNYGREKELNSLRSFFEQVKSMSPNDAESAPVECVLVRGSAGTGKSSFVL